MQTEVVSLTIQTVRQYVTAEEEGGTWFATWRKAPTQTTVTGVWFDLGLSAGNPSPNFYTATPLTSTALYRSTDGGLDHGPDCAPSQKYLKEFGVIATAGAPITFIICDYLLFYSFVDMDNAELINVASLPRYADGVGVKIMAVQLFPQSGVGNPKFRVEYTNSDEVAGRKTNWVSCNTLTIPGNIISSHAVVPTGHCAATSPFLPLQFGDRGIRSIQNIEFATADSGVIALVLVKPLEQTLLQQTTAPVERSSLVDFNKMPKIHDDAFLNIICCPSGSISGAQYHGYLRTLWG